MRRVIAISGESGPADDRFPVFPEAIMQRAWGTGEPCGTLWVRASLRATGAGGMPDRWTRLGAVVAPEGELTLEGALTPDVQLALDGAVAPEGELDSEASHE